MSLRIKQDWQLSTPSRSFTTRIAFSISGLSWLVENALCDASQRALFRLIVE